MKLLVLSQYFWPETFLINDVVLTLVAQGHEVTVATGKPNYPDGRVFDGYTASGIQRERYWGKVDVFRVPLWPRGQAGARNLTLNYLSFVVSGVVLFPWLLRGQRFDAILVFAPSPITQAIPAIPLKWLKRAPLALWVQDLWPESLQATGFVKNPILLTLVRWMVRAIYASCEILLVQSRAFIDPVFQVASRAKITYFPNCFDGSQPETLPMPEALAELFDDHFCIVFAGNLGMAQGLDTIIQTALTLKGDKNIRFFLFGSGSRFEWLVHEKELHELHNLILPGRFPMDVMPQVFDRASSLLVALTDAPIFARTVPSKVQAYLAAGRPILASINGEGARVIEEAGSGLTSPAGDSAALVRNILKMRDLPLEARNEMGRSGQAFFRREFEITSQVKKLVRILRCAKNE
jgi:glycosyltransferase involved in cell wall biosynthesis